MVDTIDFGGAIDEMISFHASKMELAKNYIAKIKPIDGAPRVDFIVGSPRSTKKSRDDLNRVVDYFSSYGSNFRNPLDEDFFSNRICDGFVEVNRIAAWDCFFSDLDDHAIEVAHHLWGFVDNFWTKLFAKTEEKFSKRHLSNYPEHARKRKAVYFYNALELMYEKRKWSDPISENLNKGLLPARVAICNSRFVGSSRINIDTDGYTCLGYACQDILAMMYATNERYTESNDRVFPTKYCWWAKEHQIEFTDKFISANKDKKFISDNFEDYIRFLCLASNEVQKYSPNAQAHPPDKYIDFIMSVNFSDRAMEMIAESWTGVFFVMAKQNKLDFSALEVARKIKFGIPVECPV